MSPEFARAPFALRCGALLVDYSVSLVPLAVTSLLARSFATGGAAGRAAGGTMMFFGYLLAAGLFALNFIVLAGAADRTLGKWVTGLRIVQVDGARLGFVHACLRHLLGYGLTVLSLGTGYLLAALRTDGRALHDLVARTIVVRDDGRRRTDRNDLIRKRTT